MTHSTLLEIAPQDVHQVVGRHLLVDGLDFVFDLEKSHGAWLYDSKNGRNLLDFMTFIASSPIGYNHPKTQDEEFKGRLLKVAQVKPSLSDAYCVEFASFLETFARVAMPAYLPHAFFIEGGTLAVENTLKVAMDYKVRQNWRAGGDRSKERGHQIVHFKEAFHGRAGYCLSLTNTDSAKTDLYPKFPWPRLDNPKLRFSETREALEDVAALEQRSLEQLRKAFEDFGDDIAGIIIEPIQGEGGDNHFRPQFIQALQAIADSTNCFFIVDEVQTGVALTGKFWAHEHYGVRPDALAFGKKTQTCGCLVGPKVDREPENVFKTRSRISSTWGGNLTDMVRFQRFLEIIEEDNLVENARLVGDHLLKGLRGLQEEFPSLVSNGRGRGLMIAFDTQPESRSALLAKCLDLGMIAMPCGLRSVRFRPPLTLTFSEADAGLDILRRALQSLLGGSVK
ncbi:MAG: L-lysine 6-transaminase [Vicinamibacteria bacterium]|nr:L-lysine 6-transaminase [Vicinamibacteria bacterium]